MISILPVILLLVFVFLIVLAKNIQIKNWNNGQCPNCQTNWQYVKSDKDGYRIYDCPNCYKRIRIIFNIERTD